MTTEEPVVVVEVAAPAIKAAATVVVEKEPTMEAAEEKSHNGKKTISSKRKTMSHPSYFDMIKDAILLLKDRSGSSQYAIAKFVEEKQKNLPKNFKKVLLIQLKRLVAQGKLVKVKASYKLPKPPAKAKPKPAPKAAAKVVAAKRKPNPPTKPAKVARTSTRSTPGKKPSSAHDRKPFMVMKRSSVVAKTTAKKVELKIMNTKAATPKKSTATRKTKK